MAKRTNLDEQLYLRLLMYGQAGSTKTRTAATAALDPRTSPVLWFDSGGNPISIRDYPQKPDIIKITKLEDYNPFYNWLRDGQKETDPIVKAFDLRPPYKTVVIDGITSTQRKSFAVVTGNQNIGPGSFPQQVEIQHFNKVLAQMVNFGELFFYELPIHVIMTALEAEKTVETTGSILYRPLLWGQSAGEIPGQALAVARMLHIERADARTKLAMQGLPEKPVSVAVFRAGPNHVAKDQYGGLPDVMPNPTVTKMLDRIFGGAGAPTQE